MLVNIQCTVLTSEEYALVELQYDCVCVCVEMEVVVKLLAITLLQPQPS